MHLLRAYQLYILYIHVCEEYVPEYKVMFVFKI